MGNRGEGSGEESRLVRRKGWDKLVGGCGGKVEGKAGLPGGRAVRGGERSFFSGDPYSSRWGISKGGPAGPSTIHSHGANETPER